MVLMQKIVRCNYKNILLAAEYVKQGKVIVYPTDTVYGLGADPYNKGAVEKVYSIKGRDPSKPFPLLCSSLSIAKSIALLDGDALRLAEMFWPGALTIVAYLKDYRLRDTLALKDKVAVRIPADYCSLLLIEECKGVLIGTSANVSGSKSVDNIDALDSRILDKVELVLDSGRKVGVESTIIDVVDKSMIREGYIKRQEIISSGFEL